MLNKFSLILFLVVCVILKLESQAHPTPQQTDYQQNYQETEFQRQIQYPYPLPPYAPFPQQPYGSYPHSQQPLMDFQAFKNKSIGIDLRKDRFYAGYQQNRGVQAKGATEEGFGKALDKVFD